MEQNQALDDLCVNTLRFLCVDAVQKANSGHPGMPMESAPIGYVLWNDFMRFNPANPKWLNRDRFVLSAGHGSTLLYSLLHLTGFDLSLEELKNFRQWGSRTPGHPEYNLTPGVEATSGPLGQGFATGVGMAIAERYLAATFNRPGYDLFDYHIFGIASDGDMMEGITHEAASLAGHLRLGKIVYFYLDNQITIEGGTDITFTEEVATRFLSYGWHVLRIDGHCLSEIRTATEKAILEAGRPSLIIARTHIGYGSPNKQDTCGVHGSPLGTEEVRLTKINLGWPPDMEFHIPKDALDVFRSCVEEGRRREEEWNRLYDSYRERYPALAEALEKYALREVPDEIFIDMPAFEAPGKMATREASGVVLNAVASKIPVLLGGSADLAPSTETLMKGLGDFNPDSRAGRNLHFGIREHAMAGVLNGMALTPPVIPFGATFLVFSDYMKPSIRLAAMMDLGTIYVFTHDSIGVGEDGPTHQPIEQLASLRSIPGLTVIRPADAAETAVAWRVALRRRDRPTALALTRQKLPILDRNLLSPADLAEKGAYILTDSSDNLPDIILIATGSEVHIALEAWKMLKGDGISARVVSFPSWELFEEQDGEYKEFVLPREVRKRIAIEAGASQGWHRYIKDGIVISLDRFGASAPADVVFRKLGFTADRIREEALHLLSRGE
jgi:transketolase